jgi:hypothetical protein
MQTISRLCTVSWVILALQCVASAQVRDPCPSGPHTLYSSRAGFVDGAEKRLVSPDGDKTLIVSIAHDEKSEAGHILLTVQNGVKTFGTKLSGFNAEVLWSPDSSAFFVTQANGGGGMGYRTDVFFLDENGLRSLDASALIEKAFNIPGKCEVRVRPNIAAVDWLTATRILVAAEVVPTSICKCMGTYSVYEMELGGQLKIMKHYSEVEAKKALWQSLGCELKNAPDKCTKK